VDFLTTGGYNIFSFAADFIVSILNLICFVKIRTMLEMLNHKLLYWIIFYDSFILVELSNIKINLAKSKPAGEFEEWRPLWQWC